MTEVLSWHVSKNNVTPSAKLCIFIFPPDSPVQPCWAGLWEHPCDKHLQKEGKGRLGKIGLIELETAEVITLCELIKEQYPNKRQSDIIVTTKSVLKNNWQGNIYLKNPQDINCVFMFCIKKTKHHENSWI